MALALAALPVVLRCLATATETVASSMALGRLLPLRRGLALPQQQVLTPLQLAWLGLVQRPAIIA